MIAQFKTSNFLPKSNKLNKVETKSALYNGSSIIQDLMNTRFYKNPETGNLYVAQPPEYVFSYFTPEVANDCTISLDLRNFYVNIKQFNLAFNNEIYSMVNPNIENDIDKVPVVKLFNTLVPDQVVENISIEYKITPTLVSFKAETENFSDTKTGVPEETFCLNHQAKRYKVHQISEDDQDSTRNKYMRWSQKQKAKLSEVNNDIQRLKVNIPTNIIKQDTDQEMQQIEQKPIKQQQPLNVTPNQTSKPGSSFMDQPSYFDTPPPSVEVPYDYDSDVNQENKNQRLKDLGFILTLTTFDDKGGPDVSKYFKTLGEQVGIKYDNFEIYNENTRQKEREDISDQYAIFKSILQKMISKSGIGLLHKLNENVKYPRSVILAIFLENDFIPTPLDHYYKRTIDNHEQFKSLLRSLLKI